MAVTKIINSETKNYKPLLTDKLVLDDAPKSGSFNGITSDAVYRAISVDSGNVPAVESTDNGKVLTASYGEGGGSFEWATAPNELPSIGSNAGKVLAVNSGATAVEWVNVPQELPSVTGNAGKVLTVNSGATGTEWANVPQELPSITGNAGKVLTVNSGATGTEWTNFTQIEVVASMPASPTSGVLYIVTGA